uniref:Cystatin-A-like n=1 Tax=Castor canadensis TaxID=51338 RepID=A0A8C0W1L8_CASCN|nr:cystatin-A-like [Castor canadensis]
MLRDGLSEARPATPEIQEIADRIKAEIEEKTNETYQEFKAVQYKSQVVAGTNLYIKVGNGPYIHVRVFRGLRGQNDLELTAYETDKYEHDELSA